jgi:hypothetical protein
MKSLPALCERAVKGVPPKLFMILYPDARQGSTCAAARARRVRKARLPCRNCQGIGRPCSPSPVGPLHGTLEVIAGATT